MSKKNNMIKNNLKSKALLMSTTALVAGFTLFSSQAFAGDNSFEIDEVLGGNVTQTFTDNVTDIIVDGGNGAAAGNASIQAGDVVNVTGTNGASRFAFRDNRDNIQSTIDGALNSNIKVIIIDKDGVFFTEDSVINVQSIVATSADVSIENILSDGALVLQNVEDGGSIILNGSVTIAEAGLAAFVSPFVTNSGIINAQAGSVVLAAGETVTLDMYGDGLVEVAVEGELADAILNNFNQINAQGGLVQITASAAKDTVDSIVNNSGIIDVSSATVSEGGTIILSGGDQGTVRNAGELVTSSGGEVNISGERFVQESEELVFVQLDTISTEAELLESESFELTDEPFNVIPSIKPVRISTDGGDVNITTDGNVEIFDGIVDAGGGNITIANAGGFFSEEANTLLTEDSGRVELNQKDGSIEIASGTAVDTSIQNAIDAIQNTGNNINTVNVGAGTFEEGVLIIDQNNLTLNGNNAGVAGDSASRLEETVLNSDFIGINIAANNVLVDGFKVEGNGNTPGILINGGSDVQVTHNIVTESPVGIYASAAENVVINDNFITDASQNAILVDEATSATDAPAALVSVNRIEDVELDGILITNSDNVLVRGNSVTGTQENGINVQFSEGATVVGNAVAQASQNGIRFGEGSNEGVIADNRISETENDGIEIRNSTEIAILGNNISQSGEDSVDAQDAAGVIIEENTFIQSGDNAVRVAFSDGAVVNANEISVSADEGVDIFGSENVEITNNNISLSDSNGIRIASNSTNALVASNTISETGDDGIEVRGSAEVSINDNVITASGDDAVDAQDATNVSIEDNIFTDSTDNGVRIAFSDGTSIIGNEISNSGDDGIDIFSSDLVEVIKNDVSTSGENGFVAGSTSNGLITLSGNTFTDNGVENGFAQARFSSGEIDISDLEYPNTFINTTENASTAIQFADLSETGDVISVVGNTLGGTVFEGYTGEDNFYVRIEDNTLLDPATGAPIVIDGSQASFDGVVPSSFEGGVLPDDTLAFIEERLFDADDAPVDGRGQIFVGAVEVEEPPVEEPPVVEPPLEDDGLGIDNTQDFLPGSPDAPDPGASVASLTVSGLPATGALDLNALSPQAGDVEALANINPEAGEGSEGISTQDVACASDITDALSSSDAVTYSFGGTFEDSISSVTNCGTGAGL